MNFRPHRDPFIFCTLLYLQASGDVATLFLLLAQLGLHAWRDMNADDLTEAGLMHSFANYFAIWASRYASRSLRQRCVLPLLDKLCAQQDVLSQGDYVGHRVREAKWAPFDD